MMTDINVMGVPEIKNYHRRVVAGSVIVSYLVRQPGEREWRPVRLDRPADVPTHEREEGHPAAS